MIRTSTFDFAVVYRDNPHAALMLAQRLLLDPKAVAERSGIWEETAAFGREQFPDLTPPPPADFSAELRLISDVGLFAAHYQGLLREAAVVERLARLLDTPASLWAAHRRLVGEPPTIEVVRSEVPTAGANPPRRQVCPGPWVEAPWTLRLSAGSPGSLPEAGRIKSGEGFPLNGWVQAFRKPGKSDSTGRETWQYALRLFFGRDDNPASLPSGAPGPVDLYENAFFDVKYYPPGGREVRRRLQVGLDLNNDLVSRWKSTGLDCDPRQCRLQVCISSDPVEAAEAHRPASRPQPNAERRDKSHRQIEPLWDDLGGEG